MSEKLKAGDKVEFVSRGRTYTGEVLNPAYYPGGSRAGKHVRINIGGMVVATVFASGPVGQSIRKLSGGNN